MEPFTIGMGMAGLLQNYLNGSSSRALAQENLQFQRQQAQNAEHMSQATRVDAAGNKQQYNPATNTWETILTPMQKALQTATETEQYRSMTEDAERNRQLRERQAQRSEQAATPYNEAVQGYMYDKPQTEGAINDKLQTMMIQSDQDKSKQGQAETARQSLRLGKGNNIPAIIKAVNDRVGADSSDAIMKSYTGAHTQRQQDVAAHDSQYLPEISKFQQIIDDGGGAAEQRFSNTPQMLANTQNNQAGGMLGAIQAAMSGNNAATSNSIRANTASNLDFSSLIKALSAKTSGKTADTDWDKRPGKVDYSTVPDYLSDIEYGRTDSSGFSY